MALPRQIQEAADAADAYLAQQAMASEAQAQPEPAQESAPEPAPVPEPQAADPQPPAPPAHDVWEMRYKSLQGMFNKEVPELQGKVRHLEGQLQDAVARLNKASEAKPEPVKAEVDPKDAENFGGDLVEMVNRVSSAQVARLSSILDGKLAAFGQQISTLYEQVGGATQHVARTAEQAFFDRLERLVPEWESVNADQRFLQWLAEVDPVYGLPRQSALEQARKSLDAARAAAVFNAFTGGKQATAKPDGLGKQVSPKSVGSAPPSTSQPRVVSSTDITKFYDDVRRGVYRGQEAVAAQKEQEFNLALAEGRVR